MREAILKIINSGQGIKGVDLVLKVLTELFPSEFKSGQVLEELTRMVKEGEIIEIEYTLPDMNYRIRSFYLPKGTKLYVNKNRNDKQTNSI